MYSVIREGKVEDIRYKRLGNGGYAVYIEEEYIGQVYQVRKLWSAVPRTPHKLSPVHGFGNRTKAMEMILKMEGIHQ